MIDWQLAWSVVAAVAAGCWAVWQWRRQREKDRESAEAEAERERKQLAALYVNPFLLAAEELQSRLYNLLAMGGLAALRKRAPEGGYAEETLYLVAQYFAWELCLYRYTPYARDPEVIRLTEMIRHAFATDSLGTGPFCFHRPEQRNLGRLLQERVAGELDVVPFSGFAKRLAPARSRAVRETLAFLRETTLVGDPGSPVSRVRTRLAAVQSLLVDLLSHLELEQGVTFFYSPACEHRRRAAAEPAATEGELAGGGARSMIGGGERASPPRSEEERGP